MVNDPISDMLTRIRNGFLVRKAEVVVPASQLKQTLAEILEKEGYLSKVEKVVDANTLSWTPRTSRRASRRRHGDMLRLVLRYGQDGRPMATHLERISRPSHRVYVAKDEIPVVLSGMGIAVLSTSQGLMTNREAKKLGVGGEVLCRVY